MTTITAYKTPQAFLDDTEKILEQKELENNLILGLCNGFADKSVAHEGCVFINAVYDKQIQASSIKTFSKAIVSGTTKELEPVKALADYYLAHGISLAGCVGERFYSLEFSNFYGKQQKHDRTMIVHKLTSVNKLSLSTGKLVPATTNDLDLLVDWTINFEEDTQTFPRQSRERILKSTQTRLNSGHIFKWVDQGETVSIAAIVRQTKNFGIIGLVYTPDPWRGRGYATSCVQQLSEQILQSGLKCCGLFTDKANPTSNHIYQKIGYFPTVEFSDIEYR